MSTQRERDEGRAETTARNRRKRFDARLSRAKTPQDSVKAAYDFVLAYMKDAPPEDCRTAAKRFVRLAQKLDEGRRWRGPRT